LTLAAPAEVGSASVNAQLTATAAASATRQAAGRV